MQVLSVSSLNLSFRSLVVFPRVLFGPDLSGRSHLTILKHRNITTTLPGEQRFRGLEKVENLIKTKAAILFKMTAVALAAGPGLERGS